MKTEAMAQPRPMKAQRLLRYIEKELAREPVKAKLTLAQRAKHGLFCFFALMLLLTFLSGAANEALVAKVTVKGVSGGVIDQSIAGQGVWAAADAVAKRSAFTGLRIDKIFVEQGGAVTQGEPLYAYEKAAVTARQKETSHQLEQYRLQIKELKTGRSDSEKSAALSLSQAESDLLSAQIKLHGAASQIAAGKRQAYEDALFAYETETSLQNSQLNAAEQAVSAAQAALDPADPATQTALSEARAALAALTEQWEHALREPGRKLERAEEEWYAVQNGTYDIALDLLSYQDAVDSASRAVENAKFNHEQSRENDRDTNSSIGYRIDEIELAMAAVQEEYDALGLLLKQECVVSSDMDGIVTALNTLPGSLSSGDAVVTLSSHELVLSIKVDGAKAAGLALGDAVTLMKDGKKQGAALSVSQIGTPDAEGLTSVLCAGHADIERTLGSKTDYIIEKVSGKQDTRIPLNALREDGNGRYYVLVIGARDTVIGVKSVAVRVDVALIAHDDRFAAVSSGLSPSDSIIVSSTKPVAAGDRVVVENA